MDKEKKQDQDEKKVQNGVEEPMDATETKDFSQATNLREQVMQSLKNKSHHANNENDIIQEDSSEETVEEEHIYSDHYMSQEETPEPHVEMTEEDTTTSRMAEPSIVMSRQKESKRRKKERQKENTMVKKIVTIVVLALIIMLLVLGFAFYKYWQSGLKPLDVKNKKLVQVEIPIGTSNKAIGSILEKDKVIKSGLVFTYYVKTENLSDFKGGYYQMSPDMTLDEVAEMLQEGGTNEPEALADARITVPEGYSVEQVAELFAKKTGNKKEEFLAAMKDEKFFDELYHLYPELLDSAKKAEGVRYRLEGYLFPATYNYYKDTTVKKLVTQMVDKSSSVMAAKMEDVKASELSIQQVLTLASLVEKEGVDMDDRRNIAQVFFNRIDNDMPLQSDISIIYALNKHKVHLSNNDTQVDSPYNLYINKGFGPGPFDNPSEEAVDAVLHPEPNDYLYFLADIKTHKVHFAKDYETHLELKEKYIDNNEE